MKEIGPTGGELPWRLLRSANAISCFILTYFITFADELVGIL